MKALITLVMLILAASGQSQPKGLFAPKDSENIDNELPAWMAKYKIPNRDGWPFYEFIDSSMKDKTKPEIHRAGVMAIAELFGDSKEVIEINDLEDGNLVGKGTTSMSSRGYRYSIPFTVIITSKDGKFRVQAKSITKVRNAGTTSEQSLLSIAKRSDGFNKEFWPRLDAEMRLTVLSIVSKMRTRLLGKDEF
jgi:hypothetical protein